MCTMSRFENLIENEKYMNDAFSTIFSNLIEKARRKNWDPFQVYDRVPRTDAFTVKPEVEKKKMMMSESKNEELAIPCENEACKPDAIFQDWCRRRNNEFQENKSCDIKEHSNSFSSPVERNKKNNFVKVSPSSTQEYSKIKFITSEAAKNMGNNNEDVKIMINKHNEKLCHYHKAEHLTFNSLSKKKIHLCIKVADMKGDKNFELISELSDFLRVKKKFPKLFENIPDIDSSCKTIAYSAEAVNIIFRFVFNFNHSLSLPAISSPITGVEVLAATQFWQLDKFYEIFKKPFLQKTLTPSNVSSVFSHAYHFGLSEICDACKNISDDISDLGLKKVKKSCILTVSTYVEPSELSIPFNPLDKSFSTSFERHVQNKIVFKGMSGTYVIKGIQVELNKKHLLESGGNELNVERDLEIDCSIRNTSNNQKLYQIEKKSVRPINVIYFKEDLIVNPGDIGEITVELDTLPYLCSCSVKPEWEEKVSTGEFELKIRSSSPIQCSAEKIFLFIISKLLYVKK